MTLVITSAISSGTPRFRTRGRPSMTVDVGAELARRGGKLQTDEPAADDGDVPAGLHRRPQRQSIGMGAERANALAAFPRRREIARATAPVASSNLS